MKKKSKSRLGTEHPSNSAVGYGRPPVDHQFKPGQSGNPRGRPKGSLNMDTAIRKAFRQKLVVKENGRRRHLNKLDAFMTQLANQSVSGNARAMQLSVKCLSGIDASTKAEEVNQFDPDRLKLLTIEELKMLEKLMRKLGYTTDEEE